LLGDKRVLTHFWFPAALAVLCFAIACAAHFFPGPFDWRYQTVSSLLSQVSNPRGSYYFCIGLTLTFAMLLPLPGYYRARLERRAPRLVAFSFHALRVGFLAALIIGLERLTIRNLADYSPKGHESLAIVAFFGHFFGLAGFWLALSRPAALVSLSPLLGIAASQAYLYFVPNELGWVGPHWADLGVPLYLSFAFWEWVASAGVFAYLYLLLLLLPTDPLIYSRTARKPHRKAS
jgi:hypothetical protein